MIPIDEIYRQRLALLIETHKGQAALAEKIGKSPAQISQWLNASRDSKTGLPRNMSRATARGIEKALALPEGWMDQPIQTQFEPPNWTYVRPSNASDALTVEPAGPFRALRPIPVVGQARLGEDGFYERLDVPDGWIDSYNSPDPDAYALRVRGDSMHPAIRHGSFVVVEPHGSCVLGEYVAIALRDGRKMVKELVIDRPEEIVVESVNGNHRRTIEKSEIESLHPVAAVVAASKWRHS